jgi:DNA-binding HxlR family transcriptional regulator
VKLEKTTKRRYDDACGAAHALDLVGERWALLVMRELMLGPKRFSGLRADLPGISANVLTQRLEGLEAAGILLRRKLPPPASGHVYELTPWGYESEPIFQVLGRWAARSPNHDPGLPLSAVSLILSFRTMFDPARAEGFEARVALEMGSEAFAVRVAGGTIEAGRGALEGPDIVLRGAPPAVAAMVYGGQQAEAMEAAGMLVVEGDRMLLERFVTLFPLPPKAQGDQGRATAGT